MKIYDKSSFGMGLLWLCAFPLFALDVIKGDWLKYMIAISLSAMFFHRAFSKAASEQNHITAKQFKEMALSRYGRRYVIRTNLPWILLLAFFPTALLLRLAFHIWLPMWVYGAFVLSLTLSTFYSIGIINSIKSEIEKNARNDGTGIP